VIAQLTASGVGVSYLSQRYCEPLIAKGKLRALKTRDPHPVVEFFAVFKKDNSNPVMDLFVNAIKKCCVR
jgi:DNA-binding transcriptional LysR family regulator